MATPTEQVTVSSRPLPRGWKVVSLELLADALGEQHRAAAVGLLAEDDELLAPEPRDDVGGALFPLEHLAEASDDHVADVVAVRVVDLLEEVDVHDEDRELAAEARARRRSSARRPRASRAC